MPPPAGRRPARRSAPARARRRFRARSGARAAWTAALPFRRTIERGFLRGVVVGEGTQQDRPSRHPRTPVFGKRSAGTDQRAGPEAPAMEARQGRDSRSEAQCAARQRDGGTPGRPTAWDRTTRCRSCAARCATVLDVQPGVVAKVQRVVLLIGRCQVHHHQEGGDCFWTVMPWRTTSRAAGPEPGRRGFVPAPSRHRR